VNKKKYHYFQNHKKCEKKKKKNRMGLGRRLGLLGPPPPPPPPLLSSFLLDFRVGWPTSLFSLSPFSAWAGPFPSCQPGPHAGPLHSRASHTSAKRGKKKRSTSTSQRRQGIGRGQMVV